MYRELAESGASKLTRLSYGFELMACRRHELLIGGVARECPAWLAAV